jgi:hypothetical protein
MPGKGNTGNGQGRSGNSGGFGGGGARDAHGSQPAMGNSPTGGGGDRSREQAAAEAYANSLNKMQVPHQQSGYYRGANPGAPPGGHDFVTSKDAGFFPGLFGIDRYSMTQNMDPHGIMGKPGFSGISGTVNPFGFIGGLLGGLPGAALGKLGPTMSYDTQQGTLGMTPEAVDYSDITGIDKTGLFGGTPSSDKGYAHDGGGDGQYASGGSYLLPQTAVPAEVVQATPSVLTPYEHLKQRWSGNNFLMAPITRRQWKCLATHSQRRNRYQRRAAHLGRSNSRI